MQDATFIGLGVHKATISIAVARATIYAEIPAKIACGSNSNLAFRNTVLPAKVAFIRPAVAAGQIVPGGQLQSAFSDRPWRHGIALPWKVWPWHYTAREEDRNQLVDAARIALVDIHPVQAFNPPCAPAQSRAVQV